MNAPAIVCSAFILCISALASSGDGPAIGELLDGYDRGNYASVETELDRITDFKAFSKQLRDVAPSWLGGAEATSVARRRLLVASVALEASKRELLRSRAAPPRPILATSALLGWADQLIRSSQQPLSAERSWRLAEIALIERSMDAYLLSGYLPAGVDPRIAALVRQEHGPGVNQLGAAIERFPDEARFKLAEAVDEEVHRSGHAFFYLGAFPTSGPTVDAVLDPGVWRRARSRYDALAADAAIRAESLVRAGGVALRLGDDEDALTRFDRVDAISAEPALIYLAQFLRAKALERLNRPNEAISSLQVALETVPRAESASTALATLLFLRGVRDEPAALVRGTLAAHPADDPWRDYAWPEWRLWSTSITRLHQDLR